MLDVRKTKKTRMFTLVVVVLVLAAMVGVPIVSAVLSVL